MSLELSSFATQGKWPAGPVRASSRLLAAALCAALALGSTCAVGQKTAWRQATDSELAALLPDRAPVEKEHIETEMRTASGIADSKGRFIAGVVLITAGYSADGKYSHYLVLQAPLQLDNATLPPGNYVFGWTRVGDSLSVHFHEALTGKLLATVEAHKLAASGRIESLHIWPPGEKSILQIGRFAIPYKIGEE